MPTQLTNLALHYRRLLEKHVQEHRCSAMSCKEAMHLWTLGIQKAREGLRGPR
jgi:hypothetical protein